MNRPKKELEHQIDDESSSGSKFHFLAKAHQRKQKQLKADHYSITYYVSDKLGIDSTSVFRKDMNTFNRLPNIAEAVPKWELYRGKHNRNQIILDSLPWNSKQAQQASKDLTKVAGFGVKMKAWWSGEKVSHNIAKATKQANGAIKETISLLGNDKSIIHSKKLLDEQKIARLLTSQNPYICRIHASNQLNHYLISRSKCQQLAKKDSAHQSTYAHRSASMVPQIRALKHLLKIKPSELNKELFQISDKDNPYDKKLKSPRQIGANRAARAALRSAVTREDSTVSAAHQRLSGELKYNFTVAYATSASKHYPFIGKENPLLSLVKFDQSIKKECPYADKNSKAWAIQQEQKCAVKLISHARDIHYNSFQQHDRDVKYTENLHAKNKAFNTKSAKYSHSDIDIANEKMNEKIKEHAEIREKKSAKRAKMVQHDVHATPSQAKKSSQQLNKITLYLRGLNQSLKAQPLRMTPIQKKNLNMIDTKSDINEFIARDTPKTVLGAVQRMYKANQVTKDLTRVLHNDLTRNNIKNQMNQMVRWKLRHHQAVSPTIKKSLYKLKEQAEWQSPKATIRKLNPNRQQEQVSKSSKQLSTTSLDHLETLAEQEKRKTQSQKKEYRQNNKDQKRDSRKFKNQYRHHNHNHGQQYHQNRNYGPER